MPRSRRNLDAANPSASGVCPARSRIRAPSLARLALLGALGVALELGATPARADLEDDAERVLRLWSNRGARVERFAPIFVEHGRTKAIAIPPAAVAPPLLGETSSGAKRSARERAEECLTVVLLSDRSAEFTVDLQTGHGPFSLDKLLGPRMDATVSDAEQGRPRSSAGALVLSRCGVKRAELRRLALDLRSGRATIEIVVARSSRALGDIADVLPERAFGPMAPRGNPGAPVDPGPLDDRIGRAERRGRADGAAKVQRVGMRASPQGMGEFDLRLGEGCHRIEVMAEAPSTVPRIATDVDAELRDAEDSRLLARDRSDAADARLDTCLGEPTIVELRFTGAVGAVNVVATDAVWPIPQFVPHVWGARARGGFAWALHRRGALAPRGPDSFETIGGSGITLVPLTVEPNHCYVAGVAVAGGDARALRIAAHLETRDVHDESTDRAEGVMIGFCTTVERVVPLEVEARGGAPWWVLAAWTMGAAP